MGKDYKRYWVGGILDCFQKQALGLDLVNYAPDDSTTNQGNHPFTINATGYPVAVRNAKITGSYIKQFHKIMNPTKEPIAVRLFWIRCKKVISQTTYTRNSNSNYAAPGNSTRVFPAK